MKQSDPDALQYAQHGVARRLESSEVAERRAKDLRKRMTPPEQILWSRLRGSKLGGLKFRRQHPLGAYIADFYCHEAGLVVELDGITHFYRSDARDVIRDRWMDEGGLRVLRFHN